jgi:hypothetical protein
MHRVVGDRTCVPEGAFTVAGLCRDLTGFATTRCDKSCPSHGTTADSPGWRLACAGVDVHAGNMRSMVLPSCAGVVVAMMLAGCIGGERLIGPTVTIRNDSARPLVVRLERLKWAIEPGQSGLLAILNGYYFTNEASFELLDKATCDVIETVSVTFASKPDAVLTVPVAGGATTRALNDADRNAAGPEATMDPNLCLGPADGLNVSVVNRSSEPYFVVVRTASGESVAYPLQVPRHGSGTLVTNGVLAWGRAVGLDILAAGSIELLDAGSCRVIGKVQHPDLGSFAVLVDESGAVTIGPAPLPTDPGLPKVDKPCAPGATPRTSASSPG